MILELLTPTAADSLGYLGDSMGWSILYFLAGYGLCKVEVFLRARHHEGEDR